MPINKYTKDMLTTAFHKYNQQVKQSQTEGSITNNRSKELAQLLTNDKTTNEEANKYIENIRVSLKLLTAVSEAKATLTSLQMPDKASEIYDAYKTFHADMLELTINLLNKENLSDEDIKKIKYITHANQEITHHMQTRNKNTQNLANFVNEIQQMNKMEKPTFLDSIQFTLENRWKKFENSLVKLTKSLLKATKIKNLDKFPPSHSHFFKPYNQKKSDKIMSKLRQGVERIQNLPLRKKR